MSKTTITIRSETKTLLEKLKGNKSWDEFLLEVYYMLTRKEKIDALEKLREIVRREDLEFLEKNLEKVRVKWRFRE
ncbi:MAG: antitoxin VapB family protein [Candidatus Njordarchaeales archaeon]